MRRDDQAFMGLSRRAKEQVSIAEGSSTMIHKLKSLGFAFFALLAIGMMAVSAASADEFQSESENTTLTGAQEKHLEGGVERNDRFTTSGGIVECSTATYKGAQAAKKVTTVSVTPTYSGCTFAGLSAVVHTNECEYVFSLNAGLTTGKVRVSCPAGKEIVVTVGPASTVRCTIDIPPQTLSGVTYSTIGAGATEEMTVAINTGATITYSQTSGIIGEKVKGTGSGACATDDGATTGSYIGAAVVTGEVGTTHTGLFVK